VTQYDVIVVGGGLAGLTATLSLADKGKKVLLLEKNDHCGGLMNSFWRDGFRFEGGARAMVNAGLVTPLLKEFHLYLEVLPNPITLGIEDQQLVIQREQSLNQYAELLKNLYPGSEDDVDKIVSLIRSIILDMRVLYGVDNPLFTKEKKNWFLMLPSVIGWTFKFFRTMHRISTMNTPFEDALDQLSSNQSLKDIIGQHFFRKTPVFFALSYFALYGDYIYPKGGVMALIDRLTKAIEDRGGTISYETVVLELDPIHKTITDAKGQDYSYKKLIWATDLKQLYKAVKDSGLAGIAADEFTQRKKAILERKGAESVFTVFLASDLPPETFGPPGKGHLFYTPDRKGLGQIHTQQLKDLLNRWDTVTKEELETWLEAFCWYNTFEISIPVLRDPDAAPPGKTGLIISALFDYELTKRVRQDGWYDQFKQMIENQFIRVLSETLYPGLGDHILFRFSASPHSIYQQVGSSEGSIVGWSFEEEIPAITSMYRMADSVKTPLSDVFTAGKWVYSPAGGPTAIMTGRIAAKKCL
jgi:all-trans-retinol 13,14-reductase